MNSQTSIVLPGATLGMLGGGQLGRMSILAGRQMGYRFHLLDPSPHACAGPVADHHLPASYQDLDAVAEFARGIELATLEFENLPLALLEKVEARVPVRPSSRVLGICQNRAQEKAFLTRQGFPCADYRVVEDSAGLARALTELTFPCIVKTADFGYDGKGQVRLDRMPESIEECWQSLGYDQAVVEKVVAFRWECSVIVARGMDGRAVTFPLAENEHRRHILHCTVIPARVPEPVSEQARALAVGLAEALDCVGLLTVECFVLEDGQVLVNEMAPRPHNSGHWTLDGAQTSQFEQHIRAVCGLPLGGTEAFRPTVMVNLLGDLWRGGVAPDWRRLLQDPETHLHLYDKGEPRPGRKMGHFTVVKRDQAEALATAERVFRGLEVPVVNEPPL